MAPVEDPRVLHGGHELAATRNHDEPQVEAHEEVCRLKLSGSPSSERLDPPMAASKYEGRRDMLHIHGARTNSRMGALHG